MYVSLAGAGGGQRGRRRQAGRGCALCRAGASLVWGWAVGGRGDCRYRAVPCALIPHWCAGPGDCVLLATYCALRRTAHTSPPLTSHAASHHTPTTPTHHRTRLLTYHPSPAIHPNRPSRLCSTEVYVHRVDDRGKHQHRMESERQLHRRRRQGECFERVAGLCFRGSGDMLVIG